MKFSNDTIKILKNYTTINSSGVFKAGNKLRTFSSSRNIWSLAEIEEEIPRDFIIYELSTLLRTLLCALIIACTSVLLTP